MGCPEILAQQTDFNFHQTKQEVLQETNYPYLVATHVVMFKHGAIKVPKKLLVLLHHEVSCPLSLKLEYK